MPGIPNPSMPGESFMDTPLVNGTAYPYLDVEPKAYRFRILNAADDRFFNLQLYVAADKTTPTTPGTAGTVLCDRTTRCPAEKCTEVKMVPVSVAPANQFADTPSGMPDPATKGPDWIQIGTEGGFLPAPVVIPQPADRLEHQRDVLQLRRRQPALAPPRNRGAGGRGRRLLRLRGQDPHPLQRRPGAVSGQRVRAYDYYTGSPDQMDAAARPPRSPATAPTPAPSCRSGWRQPLTAPA